MEPETTNNGAVEGTAKEKVEPHLTHSFEWCLSGKNPTSLTCNKAGTVEDVLRQSSQFRRTAEKNKNKELVIVRNGRAISSHFPCSLLGNERLTVKYVKAGQKQNQLGPVHPHKKRPSGELVMFHVLARGGKGVMKIMKNPAIKTQVQEITVYAYKGEKVKQALRRDGRFLNIIFKKNCVISHISNEVNTEMSNLVDDLGGETFKIILLDKSSPTESQPGSLDTYMTENESQISGADENQDPQLSSTNTSANGNTPKKKPVQSDTHTSTPREILSQIPHLSQIQRQHLLKEMKTSFQLLCVEYGKNAQTCTEVKTMKKLMDLSSYVCQVRINGRPGGSGFLLFDKFVLTNAHVLKDIYNMNRHQLDERVTVNFSYESVAGEPESGADMEVEEVASFEYCPDESGYMYDWALLRLGTDQALSHGLLTHFGFLPTSGGICIIGHPDGGVKKIDSCLIVPFDERSQVVDKHYRNNRVQIITQRFFESVSESVKQNRQALTYESCFYCGSSGSPVFDRNCRVIAMHTGGYKYSNEKGEEQSVIEFGYPLSDIIEHMIVHVVQRRQYDVLKAYLACEYTHQQNIMNNVKKLVDSRNITAFKNIINSSETENDESLKRFFEFFCQKEEPVQMEIDDL
ncbi:protein FAM111A-like isoform X2 [Anabas testudineus]|uniref:protein FAM111A-like isoform X2 n=1 Tax=Anabas testudineus TaxID=64144 RepID=UPI000E454E3F|nr:protein FAM111A-like isoform X2 [Anabas testudineus]